MSGSVPRRGRLENRPVLVEALEMERVFLIPNDLFQTNNKEDSTNIGGRPQDTPNNRCDPTFTKVTPRREDRGKTGVVRYDSGLLLGPREEILRAQMTRRVSSPLVAKNGHNEETLLSPGHQGQNPPCDAETVVVDDSPTRSLLSDQVAIARTILQSAQKCLAETQAQHRSVLKYHDIGSKACSIATDPSQREEIVKKAIQKASNELRSAESVANLSRELAIAAKSLVSQSKHLGHEKLVSKVSNIVHQSLSEVKITLELTGELKQMVEQLLREDKEEPQ